MGPITMFEMEPERRRITAETMADMIRLRDIDTAALDIKEWADETFTGRTDQGMFLKLYSEIGELIEAGDDCGLEIADILILILDYAAKKGIQPSEVLAVKMSINRTREWVRTPAGNWQHVK